MAVTSWIDVLDQQGDDRGSPASAEVLLLGFPVALGHRDTARVRVLFAELAAVADSGERSTPGLRLPRRLLELARHVLREFGPGLEAAHQRRDDAFAAGAKTVDRRYPLDDSSRKLMIDYARVLEQIDVYSRAGTLRTPATPVECYTLRRWIVEEFIRQYDGKPPRPWDGPLS